MSRKYIALFFVFIIGSELIQAQVSTDNLYLNLRRPAGLNWQVLNTEHFRIIFPEGLDSLAYRSGRILEHQYPISKDLTGGSLSRFPVVLNNYNDLTNGFVTPQNFRSEVDIAPFKGKAINPRSGSWLETVLPHELVHATQGSVIEPFSIPGLMSLFSPDIGRIFNFFPPVGVHEGLAVYHESGSAFSEGVGRGNYTYFNNQFNANLNSSSTWSMGQTLHTSDYSLPYNRHYIGGYNFTQWLHDTYGDEVSKDAIRFHQYFFFLGYGTALRRATGKWPGALYDEYNDAKQQQEQERLARIGNTGETPGKVFGSPFKGVRQRGPVWISDTEVAFFSSQYNARRGYYILNVDTGESRLLKESFGVGDFNFDYDESGNELVYAAYFSGGRYSSAFEADLQKTNLSTGKTQTITRKKRVYAPAVTDQGILALQTDETRASIVQVDEEGRVDTLMRFTDSTPVSVSAHPLYRNKLAVVMNRRGVQGLWVTSTEDLTQDLSGAPDVAFAEASVFDPEWHPVENRLIMTVDEYPAMNLYEYDSETGALSRLSNSLYNVMEPAYSPDGNSIAYVQQKDQEQFITVAERSEMLNLPVPASSLLSPAGLRERFSKPYLGEGVEIDSSGWTRESYRADPNWVLPRAIVPVTKDKSGITEFGVTLYGADVLQSHTYDIELTGLQNRLWYNATYTNTTFYPGFQLSGYSEPSFIPITYIDAPSDTITFTSLIQERGFELSLPFYYRFRDLSRTSSIFFSPSVAVDQLRYFDLDPEPLSDFASQTKIGAFAQLNLGLVQNPRDIQPSSGFFAFLSTEKALNDPDVILTLADGTRLQTTLRNRYGFYYGVSGFISPLSRLNQSLRIDLRALQQSQSLLYGTSTIVPLGFNNPDAVFPTNRNLGRISTRYTIPLIYPDDGGLLLPLYLSSVYLTAFSHTLTDLNSSDLLGASRTILGGGLHFQFNISNLGFDFGIGLAYEPARNQSQFIFGTF